MTLRNETITIGTATAAPGKCGQGQLRVGALSMGSELSMPVAIVNGRHQGPTLWLNGAVHGDEVNAFMDLRQVIADLDPETLRGAVVCTPLCNPASVHWRSKINNLDWLDMDQQFPGRADGSYSQRAAHALFQGIRRYATHLISFHTVGTAFDANPYTVYKFAPKMSEESCERVEAMALAFGVSINCRVDLATASGEIAGGVAGALDAACSAAGVAAFMAEVGSGGAFQPGPIAEGVAGVRSVMAHLGMTEPSGAAPLAADRKIVTKRGFVYANSAGMLVDAPAAGSLVKAGEPLGRIVDFFEERDVSTVAKDSIVIMNRRDPVLHEGDRIAFLALEWEEA